MKNYRILKKSVFYILNVGYLIGLIACFICNLVLEHKLTWFFIVLLGILISFTITTVPILLKKNHYRLFKIALIFTILVYLLLYTICLFDNGTWLLDSFKIATFVFLFFWIGILVWTFTKLSIWHKVSISFVLLAIVTMFTNPFCRIVLNIQNQDSNIANIISGILMIMSAIGIWFYKIRKEH